MTVKLLGGDESTAEQGLSVAVDQIALRTPTLQHVLDDLGAIECSESLDVVVAYEPTCVRDRSFDSGTQRELSDHLRRLGIIRARQGIGFAGAVHLERCAAPARVIVTDSPAMTMLGGIGMLALETSASNIVATLSTGRFCIQRPLVLQVLLSGHLCPSVSTRDVVLELRRLGIARRIASLRESTRSPIVLEFSGPGVRTLSVWERAVLCAMARDVGATSALCACDEKTDHFLRDQRRSKAYRQLTPDPGAPCSDALCVDLSTVTPLVALADGSILPVSEAPTTPVREVVIAGETSGHLRDLSMTAAWFATKRICSDVDVLIAPATHQTLETIASTGALTQLLSAGARLIEPDARLLSGEWQPALEGQSLRSFTAQGASGEFGWHVASLETLCTSAIAGTLQDPRAARKIPKPSLPRELPIDDSVLFDRKPTSPSTTLIPPPRASEPSPSLASHPSPLAL